MIRPFLKKTKIYITGGFRTASGMAQAVSDNACDGVGIGRPLGAEPYFVQGDPGRKSHWRYVTFQVRFSHEFSSILTTKLAIENFVPLPQNTQATGSQLHQIGHAHKLISDWSDEEEVKRWVEACEKETERKISILPKVDSSGYPLIRAEAGFEYGRSAVKA